MKNLINILFVLLIISCSSGSEQNQFNESENGGNNPSNNNNNSGNGGNSNDWLIPLEAVKDGGPGKDGIPSIDNPKFFKLNNATYLNGEVVIGYHNNDTSKPITLSDNDLVIGVNFEGIPKAFPHTILDWHEVVNHGGITLSYCPLTGTAYGWEAKSDGQNTTFGVSGLLYNSNLILYDRLTDSNWSQMRLQCVNGDQIGEKPNLVDVVETNWKTWRELYPNTEVLSTNTGFSRSYGDYPYGDYKTNNNRFIFTASPSSDALPNKQRVFALTDTTQSKIFQFSQFEGGKAYKTTFKNKDYLVVGNSNIIHAFELSESEKDLNFEYDMNGEIGTLFKDNEGNKWSVFGEALSGSRVGQKLKGATSVISFWFAIAAFYPIFDLFEVS